MFGFGSPQLRLVRGRGVHLGEFSRVLAATYGARVAVDDPAPTPGLHPGGTRTYDEVEEHVARLAAAHREVGHGGERVVVAIGNRIDTALHVLALARIDAVAIPVNPRLKAHELEAVAEATGAARAVADGRHGQPLPDWLVSAEAPELPDSLELVTTVELGDWNEANTDARVDPLEDGDPNELAVLLTTSGTTGVPKAAALTSRGLLGGLGLLIAAPVGFDGPLRGKRDKVLASLPLTHVMGLSATLGVWCAGLPLLRRARFDAAETLDLIEAERPNVMVAVPTMYADLESSGAADRDLSSVQVWVSAADVMPLDRARRFQQYGAAGIVRGRAIGTAAFVDIYGMVELSGAAAIRLLPPSPIGSLPAPQIAKTLPGFEVRVVDADGQVLGSRETGELQFRGPGVLHGYEGRDDAGPDADGWLSTGDHGRTFPGGMFQFSGRAKDRLKVGGFSVFPAEVETELRRAPGIEDVALVGVPDDRLGERPVAVVVPGPDYDEEAFLAWADDKVAGYRRPREVVVVDVLPRGNNDKVDRAAATELAVDRVAG